MELFDKRILALDGMRRVLALLVAGAVVGALLVVGQALALSRALCVLWEGAALSESVPPLLVFIACYMARQLVDTGRARLMETAGMRCVDNLLRRLLGAMFETGPSFVRRFGSGKITAACIEGADRIRAYIELSMPKSVDLAVVPATLSVALLCLDWISGLIAAVMAVCIVFFLRLLGENSREAAAAQHGEYERLTNHFTDILRGFPTILLAGRARAFDERVYERSEALRKATLKTLSTVTLSSLVLDIFRTFTLAAIAIMLGFRLMDGSIGLFCALAALVIVPEYFAAIRRYAGDFHATLEGKNQLAALMEMLDAQDAQTRGSNAETSLPQAACAAAGPCSPAGAVSLRCCGLGFSHPGRAAALEDVSFAVRGPCKVGIVGASGAGKTTLVSLLAGFARPCTGSFELDGAVCESLAVPGWRERVAYIPQDPHIFCATLRDNLAFYHPEATRAEVQAAVHSVGLDGLVGGLEHGLDTVVGAGARQLSGGQAQRVALARALLDGRRRVWLLDEPTAHLDIETELALKRNMVPLMEGRLVFFATHRLHWMRDMDLLVVLEGGRVVQVGTYDELASRDGAFSTLLSELQGGYFL